MDRIHLHVVLHDGSWKVRVAETISRPFLTEREAIAAAIRQAHKLGRQGHASAVVMKAMTCHYDSNGLVRAFPTARK